MRKQSSMTLLLPSRKQHQVRMPLWLLLRQGQLHVGSFGLISNAEGLQQRLKSAGYDAQIVKNADKNMYRVVATTFAGKEDAVMSRDQLRATYPDAWLLYNAQ